MKKTSHLAIVIIFLALFLIAGCRQSKEDYVCEEQSKAYFKQEFGDGMFDNREGAGTVTYKSHYNKKLKKCFLLLDENGYKRSVDKLYNVKTLLDVTEKKKYGFYSNIIGISTECIFSGMTCRSEEEWNSLVRPYMKE